MVEEELVDPECMVCLSRPPVFVFKKCGHLGVCASCCKWMRKEQFNKNKAEPNKIPYGELTMVKVKRVQVRCPYCRELTGTVEEEEYRGVKYIV